MAKNFNLNFGSTNKTVILQNMLEGEKAEYQYIQINNIEFNTCNDYADEDSIESTRELANDIKRNGLLHNIVVSLTPEGKYKLLSGERRLRAYQYLYEETKDTKYQTIYALIRKGLTETEEMIILDAANLQVRGGVGGEKRYRKASVRFIENLKKQFGISEEEAISLAKQYAGVTDAVIEKNVAIEKNLNPTILSVLDSGNIPKQQAYEYSKMEEDIQEAIGEKLSEAQKIGDKELKETSDSIADSVKNIKSLEDSLSKKEENLREIQSEKKRETNPTTKSILSSQEKEEKKNIKKIEKKLEEEKENIKNLSPDTSSSSYSFSLNQLSVLSSNISSILKSLPLSSLSEEEKEEVKKKLEKEKKRIENFLKGNF